MEYTISKTKRNLVILCSSILILNQVILGLFKFFNGHIQLDNYQIVIQNMFYIIPYGYLMLVFFDYFKHYQLKVLQIFTVTILSLEIVANAFSFINLYNPIIARFVFSAISVIWFSSIIIWSIFLFYLHGKDYPAILSIRGYAVGILLYLLLIGIVPMFVKNYDILNSLQLNAMTMAISYIFTIVFAMKLRLKE